MSFEGKVVLITGAAQGFGAATALAFAKRGAKLVLSDRNAEGLQRTIEALGSNINVVHLIGDVTDPALHLNLVELARSRFGGLDIAINNAGIVHPTARLEDIELDAIKAVINVDILGVVLALQAQIPMMIAQKSPTAIVNLASVAGLVGSPYLSIYGAAKHAVVGLTKSAAAENARNGLRINAVCPSFAKTAMLEGALDASPHPRAQAEANMMRGVPMRRAAEINEVVAAILFAASPENSFMTGETLAVDGGLSAI